MEKIYLPKQAVYLVSFSEGEILAICKDLNRLYKMNKKYLSQDSVRFINDFLMNTSFAEKFHGSDVEVGGKV